MTPKSMQHCTILIIFICLLNFETTNQSDESSTEHKDGSSDHTSHDQSLSVKTKADAVTFLTRFGYNPCENSVDYVLNNATGPSCYVNLESMLEDFQQRYNLPITRRLDVRTMKLMNTPRCGVSDSVATIADRSSLWTKLRVLKWKMSLDKIPMHVDEVRETIQQAFNDWAIYAGLTFREANESETADFDLGFVYDEHGDGVPIKEPTMILAHAFFPWDYRFRGQIHFNSAKNWSNAYDGVGFNLRLVATHEIGHSLGLSHADDQDSIMYPVYQIFQPDNIPPESDRKRISNLYKKQSTTTNSTTSGDDEDEGNEADNVDVIYYKDGSRYEGIIRDGQRQGSGTLTRKNGERYVGNWVDDEINGYGVYTWVDGTRYEGNWKDGKQSGHGILYSADGRKYNGSWADGVMDGYGIFSWSNRDRYEGMWKDDKRNGHGSYFYSDGRKYVGSWLNDSMNGFGIHTWPNGDRYEGDWKNDRRNGHGVLSYADGRLYNGTWSTGTMNGYGVYLWRNGDRYEGNWKNRKRHGYGLMRFVDGRNYSGDWINGSMDGFGILTWWNGDRYTGNWKDDRRNGLGTMIFADKRTYNGSWIDDMQSGYGIYRWLNGDRYEGDWKKNKRHGFGAYYFADGTIYQGNWEDGELYQRLSSSSTSASHVVKETTEETMLNQDNTKVTNAGKDHVYSTYNEDHSEDTSDRSIWYRLKKLIKKVIIP